MAGCTVIKEEYATFKVVLQQLLKAFLQIAFALAIRE